MTKNNFDSPTNTDQGVSVLKSAETGKQSETPIDTLIDCAEQLEEEGFQKSVPVNAQNNLTHLLDSSQARNPQLAHAKIALRNYRRVFGKHTMPLVSPLPGCTAEVTNGVQLNPPRTVQQNVFKVLDKDPGRPLLNEVFGQFTKETNSHSQAQLEYICALYTRLKNQAAQTAATAHELAQQSWHLLKLVKEENRTKFLGFEDRRQTVLTRNDEGAGGFDFYETNDPEVKLFDKSILRNRDKSLENQKFDELGQKEAEEIVKNYKKTKRTK